MYWSFCLMTATRAATYCYRLLRAAQELITRVRVTLTYSICSIKNWSKTCTKQMLQDTYRNENDQKQTNLSGSLLQYYIGKKHKYVHFLLFFWTNSKVGISITGGFIFKEQLSSTGDAFLWVVKGNRQSSRFSIPNVRILTHKRNAPQPAPRFTNSLK